MKNYVLTAAFAAACAIGVQAQTPPAGQQSPTTQPNPAETRAAQAATTTTLTGCVYRERDVPGRTPNVAERAGVLEDYILADVKMASPSAGASPSAAGATGTSGSAASAGKMYKLERIEDEKLQAVVGKRVEVTGRIDAEAGDTANKPAGTAGTAAADKSAGPDRIELPEFEVTSIKEVSGTCPAKPGAQQ